MKKTLRFLSAIVALGLGACVMAPIVDDGHVARMNSFIGAAENDVVYAWGTPDKSFHLENGDKVISYTRGQRQFVNGALPLSTCVGTGWNSAGYNSNCYSGYPAQTVNYHCEYSFNLKNGRVQGWFQNGAYCPRIR